MQNLSETAAPSSLLGDLIALLQVSPLGDDRFEGGCERGAQARLFGGQVIGQALMAAQTTVPEGRLVHSIHAYFLLAGDGRDPVEYEVGRDRDGGAFSFRSVDAMQDGQVILRLAASYQRKEVSVSHQVAMPAAPDPETLVDHIIAALPFLDEMVPELASRWPSQRSAIEFRPTDPHRSFSAEPAEPVQSYWFRAVAPVPDHQPLQRALLAYASDKMLLATTMLPHGIHWSRPGIRSASIDHTLWIHGDVDMGQWMLYHQTSDWTGGGRGLIHGKIFTRDGRLVATAMQEAVLRISPESTPKR
ncbi:acyl-CoA thioesterase domain-containing protein [Novosphingobium olei]|uniref:Acyl-CoA thioesterase 2 n=1 Tax=Novosphingobium olei TaxID=2728851 RepID=A0A7Y0BS75_9SPHN|nr:acyl-CoA thioesterase II [Novosphingobium olei]